MRQGFFQFVGELSVLMADDKPDVFIDSWIKSGEKRQEEFFYYFDPSFYLSNMKSTHYFAQLGRFFLSDSWILNRGHTSFLRKPEHDISYFRHEWGRIFRFISDVAIDRACTEMMHELLSRYHTPLSSLPETYLGLWEDAHMLRAFRHAATAKPYFQAEHPKWNLIIKHLHLSFRKAIHQDIHGHTYSHMFDSLSDQEQLRALEGLRAYYPSKTLDFIPSLAYALKTSVIRADLSRAIGFEHDTHLKDRDKRKI